MCPKLGFIFLIFSKALCKPLHHFSAINYHILSYQSYLFLIKSNVKDFWFMGTSTIGTNDWFKVRKGVWQGSILSPCLFNLYAEYIMWNAWLDEAQARIKIAGRNINNLRYADDTTLMAESEEELKSLLMKVKEKSEKAGLKLNIQKLRSWHLAPSLHGKQMEKNGNSDRLYFPGLQNHCRQWLQQWN